MSWISVDQKLIGGKLSVLRKAMQSSRNEAIGTLIGLWLWGMDNTAPDGTIRGCDRDDLAEQLSIGLDKRLSPEEVVTALIDNGWIDEGDDGSLKIHDWDEWRSEYNIYMERKRKNRERVQKHREKAAGAKAEQPKEPAQEVPQNAPEPPQQPEMKAPAVNNRRMAYPAEFDTFWKAYPRHDEKGSAYKKYQCRIKDGFSPEELLSAAMAYADRCQKQHVGAMYIKQAKTFLSDSMPFMDYIRKEEQAKPKRAIDENPFE